MIRMNYIAEQIELKLREISDIPNLDIQYTVRKPYCGIPTCELIVSFYLEGYDKISCRTILEGTLADLLPELLIVEWQANKIMSSLHEEKYKQSDKLEDKQSYDMWLAISEGRY